MAAPPIYIGVYDRDFVRRGVVGAPKFVTVIPRFNAIGTATVGVLANARIVDRCMEPGARLVIRNELGEHLMSGPIVRARGTGPARQSLLEFDIEDDFRLLSHVLGWVIPANAIDSQGVAGANWEMTGAAETVLKAAVTQNAVTRLGLPLTVETDLARGSSITAKLRFHPLYERLFPVQDGAGIDAAGIGVRIKQVTGGLRLEVYTPTTIARRLSEASGVVVDWSYSTAAPTATRVVVGGQGEAQLRVFRHVEDLAREAEIGTKLERFRDARDTNDNLTLYARGNETLADGAAKSGLSVTLSQTANFRYGSGVRVGDKVTMAVGSHVQITDTLREATLSWTQDDGWKATPKIGERTDDPDHRLYAAVQKIARYISNQNRT